MLPELKYLTKVF